MFLPVSVFCDLLCIPSLYLRYTLIRFRIWIDRTDHVMKDSPRRMFITAVSPQLPCISGWLPSLLPMDRTLPLGVCCKRRSFAASVCGLAYFPLENAAVFFAIPIDFRFPSAYFARGVSRTSRPFFRFRSVRRRRFEHRFRYLRIGCCHALCCSFVVPLFYHKICVCQDLFEKFFGFFAKIIAIRMA